MVKKLFICISMMILPLFSYAQNEMQEINKIKSNISFLYATGTSTKSAEEAADNARELIGLEIEQWLKEHSSKDFTGYVAKSRDSLSLISTKRGNLYRAFIFVKKDDILSYSDNEKVLVMAVSSEPEPASYIQKPTYTPSSLEQRIMSVSTFVALNDFVNEGRENGQILNVGNHKTLPTSGMFYALIHNRDGKLSAYLKVNDGNAFNLSTGKQDTISNYKGCGAIWIQFKEE